MRVRGRGKDNISNLSGGEKMLSSIALVREGRGGGGREGGRE